MKYFVTGATGFVGGRLARELVEGGHDVVTVARSPARAGDLEALGVVVHKGDITDRETMRAPMEGVDGVFHVAGWYKLGARDTTPGYAINVEGTRTVLELMRDLEIPKGVHTSTLAVFSDTRGQVPDESYVFRGRHLTEYDRTKWIAHYEVAEPMVRAGLPLVTVQPGVIYGPGDNSLLHATWVQYLKRRLPVIPRNTAYAWGYIDDIAHAHVLAMEKGRQGESYIVGGEPRTVADALRIAQTITGIPAPRLQIDPRIIKVTAKAVKPVEKMLRLPETYTYEGLISTAGVTYIGSNAKARMELGYQPRPLEEGLPPTMAWEMDRLGMK